MNLEDIFFPLSRSVLDDWKISWIKSLRWVRLNDRMTTLPQVQLNTAFPMIPIPHMNKEILVVILSNNVIWNS